jgi:hypothetical protein
MRNFNSPALALLLYSYKDHESSIVVLGLLALVVHQRLRAEHGSNSFNTPIRKDDTCSQRRHAGHRLLR